MICNTGGQFFLIAAIIIVGIVIGSFAIVNSLEAGEENEAFYELADEVGFESKKVLDYGVFNAANLNTLTTDFLTTYADYIAKDGVLFIYGNANGVVGWFFEETPIGTVGINTGTIPGTITIRQITGQVAQVSYDQSTRIVTVIIDSIDYKFKLREGENFFFVIKREENDEKFVAQG